VSALARFPRNAARPPIEAALGDTSARVREAAVGALGAAGGGGAATLARARWLDDPSYEVRAAALSALARLDPVGSREAIVRGIEEPSYRDAIQNAAIGAALQHPDSAMVAAIERVAGHQELPAVALAVLAARGDRHARSALGRLRDDPRPWARDWARQATAQAEGVSP
jgi:hypothetical protein